MKSRLATALALGLTLTSACATKSSTGMTGPDAALGAEGRTGAGGVASPGAQGRLDSGGTMVTGIGGMKIEGAGGANGGRGGAATPAVDAQLVSGVDSRSADANSPSSTPTTPAEIRRLFIYVQSDSNIRTFSVNAMGDLTAVDVVASSAMPNYLAVDPKQKFLLAANNGGRVTSYRIDPATAKLTELNDIAVGGGPVYVNVHKSGRFAVTGNYSGSTAFIPVGGDGTLGAAKIISTGERTHSSRFHPSGKWFYSPAVGANRVSQFELDETKGTYAPLNPAFAALPGARHMDFSPDGKFAYVISERPIKITALSVAADKGTLTTLAEYSALGMGVTEVNNFASAEIQVAPDGNFVYGSVRDPGKNTPASENGIVVYAIDKATGKLTFVEYTKTEASMPRGFIIDPTGNFLFSPQQDAKTVIGFRVDVKTGKLTKLGKTDVGGQSIGIAVVNLL